MIAGGAFRNCENLREIVIPTSLKSVEFRAFDACTSLEKVFYLGSSASWNSIEIDTMYDRLHLAARYYYSNVRPNTQGGLYWRYVNGKPTPWN